MEPEDPDDAAKASYAGRVTIGITADAQALPDAERLIAAVGHEIGELVAHGGHPLPEPYGPPTPRPAGPRPRACP